MADFLGLMKQATELKTKMEAMQAELEHIEVEGVAGAGMVKMTMTAKGELKSVALDPSLMQSEQPAIIEDLIVAAHADARRKAEALLAEKMKNLTGGLPLPPGLKLF
jgi:DNA-binding YbaB/EbfC family protein